MLRTLGGIFGVTFPYLSWLYIAVGIYLTGYQPSYFDRDTWIEILWLVSPVLSWVVIALLDASELFEFDKKAGRLNWLIAWIVMAIAYFSPENTPFHIRHESPVWLPVLVLNSVATAWVLLKNRLLPGSFRESLDRELNLFRYGTTWKPSKSTEHGSARLGSVKRAARHYVNGDLIIGTSKQEMPEADSIIGLVLRHLIRFTHFVSVACITLVTSPFKRQNPFKGIVNAWYSLSDETSKTQILRGDFNGHALVVSGSGGGKTVSTVIPNMLTYEAGSVLCIDPKSEVHAVTKRSREQAGHSVYKLKPGDIDSDAFNCIAWLDPESQSFTKDCVTVASWIFPDGGGEEAAGYYNQTAKRLFAFTLAYVLSDWSKEKKKGNIKPQPTLVTVYEFLSLAPDELANRLTEIYEGFKKLDEASTLYGPATRLLKEWVAGFVGGDMEKTWPNTVSSVTKNIAFLGERSSSIVLSGELDKKSKGTCFNVQEILNGKTSIYLCIPLDTLESTPALGRLIIGAFLNAIFRSEGKNRGSCLFMIDEMQILGEFPILHQTALNQGRGYGITLMGIIQAPAALDNQAGKGTYEAWVDNTMLQTYFMIGSEETAEKISKQIGETTVETTNYSGGTQKQRGSVLGADNSGGVNMSINRHSRRVKTASEVMNLPREYAVIFRRVGVSDKLVGKLPMIVGTCYYKSRPELLELADENPYERKSVAEADDMPKGDILELVMEEVARRKRNAQALIEDNALELTGEVGYVSPDWEELDVEATVRRMAEENPEMKKVVDALDRLISSGESNDEDEELLKKYDVFAFDDANPGEETTAEQFATSMADEQDTFSEFDDDEAFEVSDPDTSFDEMLDDKTHSSETLIQALSDRITSYNTLEAFKDLDEMKDLLERIKKMD